MTKRTAGPAAGSQKIGLSDPSYQHPEAPTASSCGDFDIRIARDGTWFYRGSPIARKPLVKLFSTVLRRDGQGEYWLVTPAERGRVTVEDAPFTAVEMEAEGQGEDQVLRFRSNVDDWVVAGPEHPIRVAEDPATGEPSPYIVIRDRLEALIVRSVFYQMAALVVDRPLDEGGLLGVWSGGVFFPLGRSA